MGFSPTELVLRAGGQWATARFDGPKGTETLYWRILLKYQEAFSQDSNTSTAWAECVFNQAGSLKLFFFGSSKYVGGAGGLKRQLPYANQYYPGSHFFDRMDLEGFQGEAPNGTCISTNAYGWPAIQGFAQYRLTFSNRPYKVLSDGEAVAASNVANGKNADGTDKPGTVPPACTTPDMMRFMTVTRCYKPESRKTPTAGFECYYDDALDTFNPKRSFSTFVIQEVGSVPTFQTEITAELVHWPYKNLPYGPMELMFGTVNAEALVLDGVRYAKGTLLFKGLAEPLIPYTWVDDERYCSPKYLFGFRPQGWSTHRLNDGRWMPIRVKGLTPSQPQFLSEDHLKLFRPESNA